MACLQVQGEKTLPAEAAVPSEPRPFRISEWLLLMRLESRDTESYEPLGMIPFSGRHGRPGHEVTPR